MSKLIKNTRKLSPIMETNEQSPKSVPRNFFKMKYKNPENIKIIEEINQIIDTIKEIFNTFDNRSNNFRFTKSVRNIGQTEILKRIDPLLERIEYLKQKLMIPRSRRTRTIKNSKIY